MTRIARHRDLPDRLVFFFSGGDDAQQALQSYYETKARLDEAIAVADQKGSVQLIEEQFTINQNEED